MSALAPAMTWEEIKANHREDIKRQATLFYKGQGCFEGEPRRTRWTACLRLVVEAWMALGPQLDGIPTRTICLPANTPNGPDQGRRASDSKKP